MPGPEIIVYKLCARMGNIFSRFILSQQSVKAGLFLFLGVFRHKQ